MGYMEARASMLGPESGPPVAIWMASENEGKLTRALASPSKGLYTEPGSCSSRHTGPLSSAALCEGEFPMAQKQGALGLVHLKFCGFVPHT